MVVAQHGPVRNADADGPRLLVLLLVQEFTPLLGKRSSLNPTDSQGFGNSSNKLKEVHTKYGSVAEVMVMSEQVEFLR